MNIQGHAALVTGGASGLAAVTARALAPPALAWPCSIATPTPRWQLWPRSAASASPDGVVAELGTLSALLNVSGIGGAKRLIGRDGTPMPLEHFRRIIDVNFVGTFDAIRQAAARIANNAPLEDGERGVIVCTSSVAAWYRQVCQEAYAASRFALASLTLPLARDLAQHGIRGVTIASGLFLTPLMAELPETLQKSLAESIPFPRRLGKPEEFAGLALHAASNTALNGEVIRLDGALRLPPR